MFNDRKIAPCLWFNDEAEQAAAFYTSVFPNGWLKDRFGVSWQVVPKTLRDMIADSDPEKVSRVMTALFPMKKLEVAALERAYEGQSVAVAR